MALITFPVLACQIDAETADVVQGGQPLAVFQTLAVISSRNDVVPQQILVVITVIIDDK